MDAPAGNLVASEAGYEALLTEQISRDDRLFNSIRFELADKYMNPPSQFFDATRESTTMRVFWRSNRNVFRNLRLLAMNLRPSIVRQIDRPRDWKARYPWEAQEIFLMARYSRLNLAIAYGVELKSIMCVLIF